MGCGETVQQFGPVPESLVIITTTKETTSNPPAPLKLGERVMQDGGQLAVEEAGELVGVPRLAHQGEHQALDVGEELWGEDVVDVLLDDGDHLPHHPLDLLVQLLGVDARVLAQHTKAIIIIIIVIIII